MNPRSGNSPRGGNSSASPWSAASHTGSGYDSLSLPAINLEDEYDIFEDPIQYFDSLPRIPSPDSPHLFLPETSTSRNRLPLSNRQPRDSQPEPWYNRYSDSPDPFDEFHDLTPPRRDHLSLQDPPAHNRQQSRNITRESSIVDLTESSPILTMPPTTRKRKAEAVAEEQRPPKASRLPGSRERGARAAPAPKREFDQAEVVDLVNLDDDVKYEDFRNKQQEELIKQQNKDESNRPVKLAGFQCIVCMDNPTDLTVTHCGHLFCSECLHQALYAGVGKKNCPVCRSSISVTARGKKPAKSGMFALEMKLMTSKKRGKQPVR